MKSSERNEANRKSESRQKRLRYQPPAIIYEGKITIRAGSIITGGAFGEGPVAPFDFPGQ